MRAIALMRNESEDSRELIDELLTRNGFASARETAAYYCQTRRLRLKSHQPPSHAPRPDPYVRLSRIRLLPRRGAGTSGRIRARAFVTRAWLWVQYVLCWCVFPLAPALRSTDSAALAPADASAVGFLRFVRRLHSYYDEVRLLVSVHHWLRLLAFPMRIAVHIGTRRRRPDTISQVPARSLCT